MPYMRLGRARSAIAGRRHANGPAFAVKPGTRMDIGVLCVNFATAQAGWAAGAASGSAGPVGGRIGWGRPESAADTPAATTAWQ